jgi:ABC-type transport system involved in multi-copper enzyme maturation permease subunit
MTDAYLTGQNPLLMRELRVLLRNPRSFALMGLYVATLGAIVLCNFPAATTLGAGAESAGKGWNTFCWLVGAQTALVALVFPALATAALCQERESNTLEALLMTPLSPLQIVWGKAGGVLALALLMVASTVPLTSLCFLLGGVSPGEMISAYAVLLSLAGFSIGWGLYCAARHVNAVQATVACYLWLPLVLAIVVLLGIGFGALTSGICMLALAFLSSLRWWRKWHARSADALEGLSRWSPRKGGICLVLLGLGVCWEHSAGNSWTAMAPLCALLLLALGAWARYDATALGSRFRRVLHDSAGTPSWASSLSASVASLRISPSPCSGRCIKPLSNWRAVPTRRHRRASACANWAMRCAKRSNRCQ